MKMTRIQFLRIKTQASIALISIGVIGLLSTVCAYSSYIPAGDYLCGYHYGPYLTIQDSIDRLFDEARRRKLPVDDCVITPNIVDQCCEGHPDNYITGLEVRILSSDEQNEKTPSAAISKTEDV